MIPPLTLLACIAFPLKEVLKDKKQIRELIQYPIEIVTEVLHNSHDERIKTYYETYYAIDKNLNFFLVQKLIQKIIDETGKEYVHKMVYKDFEIYRCSRCEEKKSAIVILPCFDVRFGFGSYSCYYCYLRNSEMDREHSKKLVEEKYMRVGKTLEDKLRNGEFERIIKQREYVKEKLELFLLDKDLTNSLHNIVTLFQKN